MKGNCDAKNCRKDSILNVIDTRGRNSELCAQHWSDYAGGRPVELTRGIILQQEIKKADPLQAGGNVPSMPPRGECDPSGAKARAPVSRERGREGTPKTACRKRPKKARKVRKERQNRHSEALKRPKTLASWLTSGPKTKAPRARKARKARKHSRGRKA